MGHTILFVDDDALATRFFRSALTREGYVVTDVITPDAAKAFCEATPSGDLTLVVLDIMMPADSFDDDNEKGFRTGILFLRWLRESSNHKNVPVIILTNVGDEQVLQEAQVFRRVQVKKKALTLPSQLVDTVTQMIKAA